MQRAIKKDLLETQKPDFYIAILPNFTPVTVLKLKVKKAAASKLPKDIYFNLSINSNERVPAKSNTIISRRFKDKIKARLNIKKLLTIIMSI
jgi:hypothetical protein